MIEVWDLILDGGGAMRGLEAKVAATRERLGDGWRVEGLLVVRGTHRNRKLVGDLAPLFRARYPASSAAWLAAFAGPRLPDAGGRRLRLDERRGRPADRGAPGLSAAPPTGGMRHSGA